VAFFNAPYFDALSSLELRMTTQQVAARDHNTAANLSAAGNLLNDIEKGHGELRISDDRRKGLLPSSRNVATTPGSLVPDHLMQLIHYEP